MNISREESACMKGYAILCIVLHNLLHLVGPLVKENEFYYNYNHRSFWMWKHIEECHENLVGDILSFFGWYGVPVFIFLSGYGLYKKYESGNYLYSDCSLGTFCFYNFKKLWLLMAPMYLIYLLLGVFLWDKSFTWDAIICQFTLTINFLCSPKEIDPGVYWYFGLTLQLYLVYRLFFFRKTKGWFWLNFVLFAALSFLLSWILQPDQNMKVQPDYEYFSHNCLRWLLPFLLGLMFARFGGKRKVHWGLILAVSLLSLGLLVACSFHQRLWIVTPIFAILFFIGVAQLSQYVVVFKWIGVWLGGLSAYIFAVHPLIRPFFSEMIVQKGQLILDSRSCFFVGLYLGLVLVIALLYRWFSLHYFVSFCERIINWTIKSLIFKKNK